MAAPVPPQSCSGSRSRSESARSRLDRLAGDLGCGCGSALPRSRRVAVPRESRGRSSLTAPCAGTLPPRPPRRNRGGGMRGGGIARRSVRRRHSRRSRPVWRHLHLVPLRVLQPAQWSARGFRDVKGASTQNVGYRRRGRRSNSGLPDLRGGDRDTSEPARVCGQTAGEGGVGDPSSRRAWRPRQRSPADVAPPPRPVEGEEHGRRERGASRGGRFDRRERPSGKAPKVQAPGRRRCGGTSTGRRPSRTP
jgi:hypothetical protein